jgi:hypothetical protein
MRTLNQLEIVQDTNEKYPFGSTVKNETEINEGTPIVSEYIGDIIQNLYKLVSLAEITPTGTEDSNVTQYQIVEALKKLPNDLNDIEQVLSLNEDVWSIPFNLLTLPNKYFLFAKASEDYNNSATYTFKGTGETEYAFASQGFVTGDELLIIINTSGVIAYSLTKASSVAQDISTTLGAPLAYNGSNKMWYQDNGKIFSDTPDIYDLQSVIRTDVEDSTVIVNDIFIMDSNIVCFCFIPIANTYFFRKFELTDLSTSTAVTIVGGSFDDSADFSPYIFASNRFLYVTNNMNSSADDFLIVRLNFNSFASTMTFVSSTELDETFIKTTNGVVVGNFIYTMISGELNKFNVITGTKTTIGTFPSVAGQLFGFDNSVFFGSGEIAKKWNLIN